MNSLVRKWGEQIIRSRQYAAGIALVVAFFAFFNLPIGWLSTVVIALVTLQNGPKQGIVVLSWAVLPAVALLCLGEYGVFINIGILHYLVVWGLAATLRRHHSWAQVIQLAALMGVISVVGIYFLAPDLQNWLVNQLTTMVKEYKNFSFFNLQSVEIESWLKYIEWFATGLLALAIILANLTTLFFARWWQSIIVPTMSLHKECYAIRMPYLCSILLTTFLVALYFNVSLFVNVIIVALIPFILSGLSLLHAYLATKKNGSVILFVFYMLFLFLSPYLVFVLSFLGWLDSFINFRKKFLTSSAVEN